MAIVHRIVSKVKTKPPASVPDNKRPLNDRGLPGGLPPAPIKPAWKATQQGTGIIKHTHS